MDPDKPARRKNVARVPRATGDDGEDARGAGEEDITAAEAARRADAAINVKKRGGARRAS